MSHISMSSFIPLLKNKNNFLQILNHKISFLVHSEHGCFTLAQADENLNFFIKFSIVWTLDESLSKIQASNSWKVHIGAHKSS